MSLRIDFTEYDSEYGALFYGSEPLAEVHFDKKTELLHIELLKEYPLNHPFDLIKISDISEISPEFNFYTFFADPELGFYNEGIDLEFTKHLGIDLEFTERVGFNEIYSVTTDCVIPSSDLENPSNAIYLYFFLHFLDTVRRISPHVEFEYRTISSIQKLFKSLRKTLHYEAAYRIPLKTTFPSYKTIESVFDIIHSSIRLAHAFAIEQVQSMINDYSSPETFSRSIEFEPEHFDFGAEVLRYFGTYLREKYPDEKPRVRIEQQERIVKLFVNTESGEEEVVEKAFNEYGLMMSGAVKPDQYFNDPILIAKYENKIDLLNHELVSMQRIIKLQENNLEKFMKLLEKSVSSSTNVNFSLSNSAYINQMISMEQDITAITDLLEQIATSLKEETLVHTELQSLIRDLEQLKNETDPEAIKKSSGMKKLWGFVDKFNDGHTFAENVFKTGKKGQELVVKLAPQILELLEKLPG
ncbi:MAG: hypothetical protein ED557_14940 [Balneola sp.]|nr:MAG: hypothetical protein ED557_14940 [Balneola sp.]